MRDTLGFLCSGDFITGSEIPSYSVDVSLTIIEAIAPQKNMAIRIPAEAFRVFLLCVVWYTISSTNSVVGKKLLNEFPHPTTVAFAQVFCTALFLGPTLVFWRVPKAPVISKQAFYQLIIPLSFGKALAAVSAYFSIWKVSVSYAHTG